MKIITTSKYKVASTKRKMGTKKQVLEFLSDPAIPDNAACSVSVMLEDKLSDDFYDKAKARGLI